MNFYIAVLLGAVIFLLFQLNGVFEKDDFSWKKFYKSNLIPTVLNLVIGWTLVLAKDDIVSVYTITIVSAIILGSAGQAIWNKITAMFNVDKPTKIGVNK